MSLWSNFWAAREISWSQKGSFPMTSFSFEEIDLLEGRRLEYFDSERDLASGVVEEFVVDSVSSSDEGNFLALSPPPPV